MDNGVQCECNTSYSCINTLFCLTNTDGGKDGWVDRRMIDAGGMDQMDDWMNDWMLEDDLMDGWLIGWMFCVSLCAPDSFL